MKKLLIILLTIFTSMSVNAEITTYERTVEDLRINDHIIVTYENKQHILYTPSVDEKQKVYDFANLLTAEEENNLYNKISTFITTYNMDLAIVTINENYTTARNYADNFYDYNYFGIGDTYDGLLVLIDMDTREFYISTTGQAILMYNDYRINRVLDDMTSYMQNGEYYLALHASINSLSSYAQNGIPEDNSSSYIDENGDYIYVEHKEFPILPFLFFSALIATIVLIIFINKNKLVKKAYKASAYIEDDKKHIKNLGDIFINTHTSRVRINTDSGSSGGSSGRSSTHRSSSGRSHGGGGRSF